MSPDSTVAAAPGVRLVRLQALADDVPNLEDVLPYLADPAPEVRAAAIDVLTETVPGQCGVPLAEALGDADARVRQAAIAGLEETRQWFREEPAVPDALEMSAHSPDPAVRAAVVRLCQRQGWKDEDWYAERIVDDSPQVRNEAVRGLVALDALGPLHAVVSDPSPEVRRLAAEALARVRSPGAAILAATLVRDPEHLVRAKALESIGTLGCPPEILEVVLELAGEEAWQVRKGVAAALANSVEPAAMVCLCTLSTDPNLDVRRAAIQSLTPWACEPAAIEAIVAALVDVDADVRGYARIALDDTIVAGANGPLLDRKGTASL